MGRKRSPRKSIRLTMGTSRGIFSNAALAQVRKPLHPLYVSQRIWSSALTCELFKNVLTVNLGLNALANQGYLYAFCIRNQELC